MMLLDMLSKKKQMWIIVLLIMLVLVGYSFFSGSKSNVWGDESDEPFITISGNKPKDANLVVWANFWVTGDTCEAYSYDMFGQKAQKGGKISQKITFDFSKSSSRYEFRIPYQTTTNSEKCEIELRNFTIEAFNAFDTAGFAQLRVSPAGSDYYNRASNLDTLVSAKDCNANVFKSVRKVWVGAIGCYFYIDNKQRTKDEEFNAFTVYYDFSKFNDDTVIHYDISAGEGYRTEPVDENHGTE